MKLRLFQVLLVVVLSNQHPAQALTPLPQENPDEICRQVVEIEHTAETLIKQVLRTHRFGSRSSRIYRKLRSELGQLAFGWDTVVPFQADDLDGIAIAASNFVDRPDHGETTYEWGKALKLEINRLQADYGCS